MAPSRFLALAVALWAGLNFRREVRLTEDTVLVDADPDEIVDRFRSRLSEGPDVLATEHDRLVRRFSGRAGRFRYETVELVTYGPTAIGFEQHVHDHLIALQLELRRRSTFGIVGSTSGFRRHARC